MKEGVTQNTQEALETIKEMEQEGVINNRLAGVLERGILSNQYTYNSIGTVSKDVKALTVGITQMSSSVELLMSAYEENREKNLMEEA